MFRINGQILKWWNIMLLIIVDSTLASFDCTQLEIESITEVRNVTIIADLLQCAVDKCSLSIPANFKLRGFWSIFGPFYNTTFKLSFLEALSNVVLLKDEHWDWEAASDRYFSCDNHLNFDHILMLVEAAFLHVTGFRYECGFSTNNRNSFDILLPKTVIGRNRLDYTGRCLYCSEEACGIIKGEHPIGYTSNLASIAFNVDFLENKSEIVLSDVEKHELFDKRKTTEDENKFNRRNSFRRHGHNKIWKNGTSIIEIIGDEYAINCIEYEMIRKKYLPGINHSTAFPKLSSQLNIFILEHDCLHGEALVYDTESNLLNAIGRAWDAITKPTQEEFIMKNDRVDWVIYGLYKAILNWLAPLPSQ